MSEKGQRNKVAPILSLLFSFTVLQPDNNSLKTSATLLHAQPNCNCASNSQGRKTTSLSLKFLNRQAIYCHAVHQHQITFLMSLTVKQHRTTPYFSSRASLPPFFHSGRQILFGHLIPELSIPNYTWIKFNVAVLLYVQIHCCLILPVLYLVLIYSDWLVSQQQAEEY